MFCQLRHNGRQLMLEVSYNLTMRVRTNLHIRIRCTDSALCHHSVCVLYGRCQDLSRLHPQISGERPLGIQFRSTLHHCKRTEDSVYPLLAKYTIIHRHPCPIRKWDAGDWHDRLNPGVGCIYRWSSNGFLP